MAEFGECHFCLNPSFTGTYLLSGMSHSKMEVIWIVLILLLLELTFWVGTQKPYTSVICVLILLLLELTFWAIGSGVEQPRRVCLNPSFTGTYLLRSDRYTRKNQMISLNPSFTGTYLLSLISVPFCLSIECLNPSFTGTYLLRALFCW